MWRASPPKRVLAAPKCSNLDSYCLESMSETEFARPRCDSAISLGLSNDALKELWTAVLSHLLGDSDHYYILFISQNSNNDST